MTSIAVFGDIHGNMAALESVLADITARQPDHLVCLGDLVGYGAHPNEVVDVIRSLEIPTIMGNYDDGIGFERGDCGCAYKDATEKEYGERSVRWTASTVTSDNKKWLQTLLPELQMDAAGTRFRFVHGSPRRINEYLFEDRDQASLERIAETAACDVLVFGHTHKPWNREIAGVQFVNAGSVGKPKDGDPRACWALLTVTDDGEISVEYHRVDYDIAAEAEAIRMATGLPDVYADDIETGGATKA